MAASRLLALPKGATMCRHFILLATIASVVIVPKASSQDSKLPDRAKAGLRKAFEFFRDKVSTEGGYLWRYSADLARREGEAKASATQVWVQPPGTPSVGQVWLDAFHATGDR